MSHQVLNNPLSFQNTQKEVLKPEVPQNITFSLAETDDLTMSTQVVEKAPRKPQIKPMRSFKHSTAS